MQYGKILSKIRVTIVWTIKNFLKLFLGLMAIVGFCSIFLKDIDIVGDCADSGGVWDDEYRECRFDCNHWDKNTGCDLLSDEELMDYVNGYCNGEGKGLYRCQKAKLEWSKRVLRDKMNALEEK